MKRWNRLLAVLLAALLLMGAWTATAEPELEIDAPAKDAGVDLEIVPEDGGPDLFEAPDAELALPVDIDLPDLDASEIEIPEEAPAESTPASTRSNDDSDFVIKKGVLVEYTGDGGDVVIPDGVTSIGNEAFSKCTSLTSVTMPDSVTRIEDGYKDSSVFIGAFSSCHYLKQVTFSNNLTHIGNLAFWCCFDLDDIDLPNSLTEIGEDAFGSCDGLTEITIPASVALIRYGAFSQCNNLTSVWLSGDSVRIEEDAFWGSDAVTVYNPDGSERSLLIPGLYEYDEECYDDDDYYDNCNEISNASLKIGDTLDLVVIYADGRSVSWSSSDKTIATVNDGTVTGRKAGKCTITAELSDGTKLTCKVTVTDGAKLSKTALTVYLGGTAKLTVRNLAGRTVTWSSSNKKVATVKNGTVTAVKAGKCTVTAQVKNGKKLTCKVTVTDGAKLSKTALSLNIGKSAKLTVRNLAGRAVTWSSSNDRIATIKNGTVKAVKAGKCTVTAQVKGGKKLTCKVTVTDPAKLSKTSLTLLVGKTATLSVSGLMGRKVTWSSSNSKIATVTRGKVKAEAVGSCNIIANLGNRKLTCKVTVEAPLTGDIQGILGKNMGSINKRLPDKLRYFDEDAYTNDYFLVQVDDSNRIYSIALLTDAESGIGKYTLYGLYPGMAYDKACSLLAKKGWKLDTESYSESYFYNPKNSDVSFYVTIVDDCVDLIVYMYKD